MKRRRVRHDRVRAGIQPGGQRQEHPSNSLKKLAQTLRGSGGTRLPTTKAKHMPFQRAQAAAWKPFPPLGSGSEGLPVLVGVPATPGVALLPATVFLDSAPKNRWFPVGPEESGR